MNLKISDKSHMIGQNVNCPVCLELLDGASGFNTDNAPKEGDISICIYCGEILIFNDDFSLSKANSYDILQFQHEAPDNYRALLAIQNYVRQKNEGSQ